MRLLHLFSAAAILHDHVLDVIAEPREFQAIAKPLTTADHGFKFCFSGRVRKPELQAHGCADRDGARNICAEAAPAQAVGPPEGSIALSLGQERDFQTDVNFVARPAPCLRAWLNLLHGAFPFILFPSSAYHRYSSVWAKTSTVPRTMYLRGPVVCLQRVKRMWSGFK